MRGGGGGGGGRPSMTGPVTPDGMAVEPLLSLLQKRQQRLCAYRGRGPGGLGQLPRGPVLLPLIPGPEV